ncbi:MAG: DUF3662 domain-containing protein [Clostridia bacterium]|nr:DUF3662 domain-containing protein [Clostridia bacterium]
MITRFEDFLGTRLEGLFKRAFPRPLEPGDLAKALYRHMLRQRLKSIKYVYAPNFYLLRMNPRDYQGFASYQQALVRELADYLEKKARERNLHLLTPLEIKLDYDPQVPQGKIAVFGRLQEGLDSAANHEQGIEEMDTLVYHQGGAIQKKDTVYYSWLVEVVEGVDKGQSFPLVKSRNLIGRQATAEISLLDPSVSRHHAQIEVLPHQVLLTDLGSTNGTYCQGKPVDTVLLSPGDRFQVGNSTLELQENGYD